MATDALVLLGENHFGRSLHAGDVLALCDAEGVEHVVAAPARPHGYDLAPANDALATTCAASAGRIVMLGRVDPLSPTALQEARRCIDELGAKGLFLHPQEEACPVSRAGDVVKVAAERGVPVVVAAGYFALSEPLQIGDLAGRFPDVQFVMTTGGQINISGLSVADAWAALVRLDNLAVMTNGEYRQDFIEKLARELDVGRVLYASFAPTFDFRFERRRLAAASLAPAARRAIEHDNAARIFGLDALS